jgi:hypothetical protein
MEPHQVQPAFQPVFQEATSAPTSSAKQIAEVANLFFFCSKEISERRRVKKRKNLPEKKFQ